MGALRLNNDFLRLVPKNLGANEKKCVSSYRFGFNGMEKDDEIHNVTGSMYTSQFRAYDPRIARWISIDPKIKNFPWQSPYVAFDNNPIYYKDPKGAASESADDKGKRRARKAKRHEKKELKISKRYNDELKKYMDENSIDKTYDAIGSFDAKNKNKRWMKKFRSTSYYSEKLGLASERSYSVESEKENSEMSTNSATSTTDIDLNTNKGTFDFWMDPENISDDVVIIDPTNGKQIWSGTFNQIGSVNVNFKLRKGGTVIRVIVNNGISNEESSYDFQILNVNTSKRLRSVNKGLKYKLN